MTTEAMGRAADGRLAELLEQDGGWITVLARAGSGLGLAAVFGLALGARQGGSWLWAHAVGVAAAPALVLALGVPAFGIVLASFDAPLGALDVARAAARGVAALGAVLAGLAPLTALYVVSGETHTSGAVVAALGLLFAGVIGVGHFHVALKRRLEHADLRQRSAVALAATGFAVLATITAARVWLGELPIFGGGL